MYNICNANYCFTDNAVDSVNSRANRARLDLAAGEYERWSSGGAIDEFTIDFTFNAPVTFNSLTLKKVLQISDQAGDYMDVYKGICLRITNSAGTVNAICTDTTFGFTNGNAASSTESTDATQDIVFDGTGIAGATDIVSAQLTFDTSASGSNLGVNDKVKIAQVTIDSIFPEE